MLTRVEEDRSPEELSLARRGKLKRWIRHAYSEQSARVGVAASLSDARESIEHVNLTQPLSLCIS